MDAQIQSMPDQGIEARPSAPKKRKAAGEDEAKQPDPPLAAAGQPRFCIVCKKRHEPRCEITEEWRREQRERKKAAQRKRNSNRNPSNKNEGGGGGKKDAK